MLPSFPITTQRLTLRPFTIDDLDEVWAYQRLPEVARHLRWEARSREQSRTSVTQMTRETTLDKDGDCLCLAVTLTGAVIGQVELTLLSTEHRQGELGYVFNPAHHGKGYAAEAARALLRLGFEEVGLHRVIGRCSAANNGSATLMARLGMRREAHFVHSMYVKDTWRDEYVYAIHA